MIGGYFGFSNRANSPCPHHIRNLEAAFASATVKDEVNSHSFRCILLSVAG
jgi:hypothetical protein